MTLGRAQTETARLAIVRLGTRSAGAALRFLARPNLTVCAWWMSGEKERSREAKGEVKGGRECACACGCADACMACAWGWVGEYVHGVWVCVAFFFKVELEMGAC